MRIAIQIYRQLLLCELDLLFISDLGVVCPELVRANARDELLTAEANGYNGREIRRFTSPVGIPVLGPDLGPGIELTEVDLVVQL